MKLSFTIQWWTQEIHLPAWGPRDSPAFLSVIYMVADSAEGRRISSRWRVVIIQSLLESSCFSLGIHHSLYCSSRSRQTDTLSQWLFQQCRVGSWMHYQEVLDSWSRFSTKLIRKNTTQKRVIVGAYLPSSVVSHTFYQACSPVEKWMWIREGGSNG